MVTQVIKQGGPIYYLMRIEHAYILLYSPAKGSVKMAGFAADNILREKIKIIQ
ncbi:hypothetical protein JCM30204_32700 [Dysgonomonas termitidis]